MLTEKMVIIIIMDPYGTLFRSSLLVVRVFKLTCVNYIRMLETRIGSSYATKVS